MNIVIIGAGIGGIVLANQLSSRLNTKKYKIFLIEKSQDYVFSPSLLWMIVGKRKGNQITRKYKMNPRIHFIQGGVHSINFKEKQVLLESNTTIEYDHLILSPGASLYPDRLPGFTETALNLYTKDGAEKIWTELEALQSAKITILISSLPFKCPAAPYEAAFLIADYAQKNKKNFEIQILTPELLPMPAAGSEVGEQVLQMLQKKGIVYTSEQITTKIDRERKIVETKSGKEFAFDLLIGIPPHAIPKFLEKSELVGPTGFIPVDGTTFETKIKDVYAIGDVTSILMKNGKPLPKAGVFAHTHAEVLAANLILKLENKGTMKKFTGVGSCFLEVGGGKAGFAQGSFLHEPAPFVRMKPPARFWHLSKVLFEKWWLWKWF